MAHHSDERCRALLEAKARELDQSLRDRRRIAVQQASEEYELMTLAAQRDFAVAAMDRDSRLIKEVRAALKRIEHGGFGVCEACEEAIQPKRLYAVPWTRRCLRCQELLDSELTGSRPVAGPLAA